MLANRLLNKYFLLLISFWVAYGNSYGQQPTSVTSGEGSSVETSENYTDDYKKLIRIVIADNLDNVATEALARFYPRKYFTIETSVVIEKYPNKLPYTSDVAFLNTFKNLPIINLRKHLTSINVKISLSERINPESQDQIAAVVKKALLLNETDTTSFEALKLTFESEDDVLRKEISQLEADIKAKVQEIGTLTRERNDVSIQNTTNKTNVEAELAKNVELENQLSITKEKLGKTEIALDEAKKGVTSVLDHPRITIILAILGAGTLVLGIVFFMGFRGLASAFLKVAENIGEIGTAIPELAKGQGSDLGGPEILDGNQGGPSALPGAVGDSAADMSSVAELQHKVIEIQDNILSRVDESNLQSLITHISSLLSDPGTFEAGIASMELLGPEMANKIFSLLGENQKKPIRSFLTSSTYSQPKTIALYNAGQALMTFLSMETMSSNFANKNPQVTLVTSKLEIEDQFQLAHKLSENALSRLMLYIKPEVIVEITKYCETASPEQSDKCLKAISKISEAVEDESLDQEIISTTEELLTEIGDDKHRNYMRLYVNLGNQLSDNMGTKLKSIMAASSEKVGAYLQKEILNLDTYYLLSKDTQTEVLSTLSNKNIASITVDMPEEESSEWTLSLSERRKESILEMTASLKAQTPAKKKQEMEDGRKALKDVLVSLKVKEQLIFASEVTESTPDEAENVTAA